MTSTAREQIASLLGTIGAGSFAARRTATADDLELAVKGVGPIRLPIPREQAQRLLSMSRPARYGQREQTLLDWRVRDTGEIPARRVKINRRRWNRTLQPMLAALGTDLGLAPEQRLAAELHSLLIYGPGQFFKRHQDSERADGMVGTLVVTLPSTFTGGAIVVEHQGEAVAYRATKQPLSFIAFYADCRHEIRPVRSGYRIVLTHDLMLQGEASAAPSPASAVVGDLILQLREHFTTPLPAPPYGPKEAPRRAPPSRLVYLLDHEYTERGLGWGRLKGSDAARAAALRAAAERAGCEVVLALAAVQETRECEEPWEPAWHQRRRYWQRDEDDEWLPDDEPPADDPDAYVLGDLIDSSVTLERWIDTSDGAAEPIVTAVAEHEVCATTPSSALIPHAAEYEGYMGNYGNTMDRWYRRAAIVLWPRERDFAVRAEASPGWALAALLERLRAGELRQSRKLAASLLPSWSDLATREEHRGLFAQALRVAALLESPELAAALLRPFQLEAVTPGLARDFAALIARYGEDWTRDLLARWASPGSRRLHAGERDVLTWLSTLEPLAVAIVAPASPAGAAAARLLVEDGWRALRLEIRARRRLSPPSLRERALAELARPILGWLGGAAILEENAAWGQSATATAPDERPIGRAVGYLCAAENVALVPCLVRLLRAAVKRVKPARRGALGLYAIARHCAQVLAARLGSPPRAADDWAVAPPTGCDCTLCRKLAAFLSDSEQRRLEWPLAKPGRQHVHQRIDHDELPVRHETRRSGSPYTLVLEKATAVFSRETAARRAWQVDLDWLAGAGWTPASDARQ
jgi:2-oxoglutarate-Fe(II)-dependent oxygenase superfamily protein